MFERRSFQRVVVETQGQWLNDFHLDHSSLGQRTVQNGYHEGSRTDRRRMGALIEYVQTYTHLVIIELATTTRPITERKRKEMGKRAGKNLRSLDDRTKVSFRRNKKVDADKEACQCETAILSGRRIGLVLLCLSNSLPRRNNTTYIGKRQGGRDEAAWQQGYRIFLVWALVWSIFLDAPWIKPISAEDISWLDK